MRTVTLMAFVLSVSGCVTQSTQESTDTVASNCIGSTQLIDEFKSQFELVDDAALLEEALGEPEKGKLCQGQVYRSKVASNVLLYRAWNSTNPNSQFGHWWAFSKPAGAVSTYRSDYEICYQWSPLDELVSCQLKPGTKVVVGNGQSAFCSDYLTYPVSEAQQVYLADAESAVTDCRQFTGVFSWQ